MERRAYLAAGRRRLAPLGAALRAGAGGAVRLLRPLFRPARLLLLGLAGLTVVLLVLGWSLMRLPVDGGTMAEPGTSELVLEAADGAAFGTRGGMRGEPVAADRLPQPLADAVVAIEDRRFRDHGGIDLRGIFRAGIRNILAGRTREGASTITQQLARLHYLSADRTLLRKIQEAMLALWLERQLPKDEILARYLNSAYFGAGAWGADAAARRYFGKGADELGLAEAAMLAGLVRAPSQLAPTRNLEGARRRADLVLAAMVEAGSAREADAAAARAKPATLRTPPEMIPGRGWFADWADGEARRQIGPLPVDLAVRTTLETRMQDVAERVIGRALDREGKALNVGQAALVALANDGAVLAAVGGRDYAASQFNRITQARRQPGSLFKVFVYAAALEAGWTPDSPVVDEPIRVGDWQPQNFADHYRGRTSLRDAFANSINSVAVRLSESVGRDKVIDAARRLGVRSDIPAVPSIALGTAETSLIELTGAYATIATGRRVEPYLIRAVRAHDREFYTRAAPANAPSPLAPGVRQQLIGLMSGVVQDGTGRAARIDRPAAGKTGTTQDHRDSWFIGFTADMIVGVWIGNDDNTPMKGATGGDLPARIWRDFMMEAGRAGATPSTAPRPAPPPAAITPVPPAMAEAGGTVLRGRAAVIDSGTLRVERQVVRLAGVIGFAGQPVREMTLYLAGRDVECEPSPEQRGFYRCRVDGRDISQVVVFNGGGRAANDADPALLQAEEQARAAGRGLWSRY